MTTRKIKIFSGSRKKSKATATISNGTGKVKVNNVPVEIIEPRLSRERILAPLELASTLRDKVDIDVTVQGGGFMGQADAAAVSISRALIGWTKSDE